MSRAALAAAQLAFHTALPEKWKTNRSERLKGVYPMPDYSEGEYLIEWTRRMRFKLHPARGFMTPLTFSEVLAFFSLHGLEPESWEVDAVMDISRAYITGWGLGLDETSYSPMELDRMEREKNVRS